ncbi:MAG: hypothetical protein FWG87_02350 [Defluviitaleaceae bacterium]|nr:hypothetical protein [Defluviitaleaceae bacterium]
MRVVSSDFIVPVKAGNRKNEAQKGENACNQANSTDEKALLEAPAKDKLATEESEEVFRITRFGITTIVYSCGKIKIIAESDENPELRSSKNPSISSQDNKITVGKQALTAPTNQAYKNNLWANVT